MSAIENMSPDELAALVTPDEDVATLKRHEPTEGAVDGAALRQDFPIFEKHFNGKPLTYLDTAATSQKPRQVVDRLARFYLEEYGTVRRGVYHLSQEATALYEGVRENARAFLGAAEAREIVFVRGVTEGINLVASSMASHTLVEGDEILISGMEHHANILPWQRVCRRTGARLRVAPLTPSGEIDREKFRAMLTERTRLVSFVHLSNALGTFNPARELIADVRARTDATVLLDGAQSASHEIIDVQKLDCDFFVCSGHKMFGPTGVGLLYGRASVLDTIEPWLLGGEMVDQVGWQDATFDDIPHRFEAGTPPFAQVIGLGAALDYIRGHGRPRIARWEQALLEGATTRLCELDGVRITGEALRKGPILAFTIDGIHPFDLGTILDQEGVAIRCGQHCAQPLLDDLGVASTARASFSIYNTNEDVDRFIQAVRTACEILR